MNVKQKKTSNETFTSTLFRLHKCSDCVTSTHFGDLQCETCDHVLHKTFYFVAFMTFKISAITASAAFKSRSFDCVLMFADARAFMDFIAGAGAAAFLAFSNAFMDFDMVMNAKEDDLRNV